MNTPATTSVDDRMVEMAVETMQAEEGYADMLAHPETVVDAFDLFGTPERAVTRTRTVSEYASSCPCRVYSLPNDIRIQVYRHRRPVQRWASLTVAFGDNTLAVPHSRHIAAINLWEHRNDVVSVYEFPREKAS